MVTCDNGNNHSSCQLSARTARRVKDLFHTALLLVKCEAIDLDPCRKSDVTFLPSMTLCHRRHTVPAGTIAQKDEMMEPHTQPQLLWCKRERWKSLRTGLSRSATKETNRPTHATVQPYRTRSCRDNLQQPVAPRRQGPWGLLHSSRTGGLWVPSLFVQYPRWFESTSCL